MKCPVCPDATLLMSSRQGVEIDYCPQCRGVWLDRGELDKLLDLSAAAPVAQPVARPVQPIQPDFVDSDYRGGKRGYPRRQKSWLSEIFD